MKNLLKTGLMIIFASFLLSACNGKKEENNKNKKVLTERIQYDVIIKLPNPEFDWWMQNIEGGKRETFVKTFIQLASSGKVKVYDYDNQPLSKHQIDSMLVWTDTIINVDPETNKSTKVAVKEELNIQKVTKVRFLEEWYLDENKLSFDKKVVGMMLMKEHPRDSVMYYSPLFWIYFDDQYPAKLK